MDSMKGLFGGGEAEDQKAAAGNLPPMHKMTPDDDPNDDPDSARDFMNRVMSGPRDQGYSDEEAVTRFQQAAKHATPEQMQSAVKQAMSEMDEGQRADFEKMLKERQAGVQRQTADGGGGGSGLDDMLGQILGGAGGSGGGGLGDILGGLLGGGASANTGATSGGGGGGGGLGDMLGGLLGSPAGKAAVGSIAAILMGQLVGGKKG
jgi:hypothetical protein